MLNHMNDRLFRHPLFRHPWFTLLCITAFTLASSTARSQQDQNVSDRETSSVEAYDDAETLLDDPDVERDADPEAIRDFRPVLAPYGRWVDDPVYGLIWVPNQSVVGDDFQPYVTAGHWEVTDDGQWLWVSDYPWG